MKQNSFALTGARSRLIALGMLCAIPIHADESFRFTDDGGFVVQAGNHQIRSCSFISCPGGGWYQLGAGTPAPGNLVTWKPRPLQQPANTREWTVSTEKFHLTRIIRRSGPRIEIEDTLANISNADLGWMIRNELALPPNSPAGGNVHLGGDNRTNPSPVYSAVFKDGERLLGIDCWRPANPTVYVPFADFGIGMVMEDTVSRVHGLVYYRNATNGILSVGLRDERFALAPGDKYTMRWAVYLIPGKNKDYYDFINQVRSDWKVNDIRVPGPTIWSSYMPATRHVSDKELRSQLQKSEAWATSTSLGGWSTHAERFGTKNAAGKYQVGFGAGVMDPHFERLRNIWSNDAQRIHRIKPNLNVIHYFHMFLNDPEREPGAFLDSGIVRPDGSTMMVDWGFLGLTPSHGVYPTLTNTMGREMFKVLDMMLGPMNGDGIYLDEVNYPTGIGWMGSPTCTYGQWDGYSADLDPITFAILRKPGYLQLLSAEFKRALFDRLAARGAIILGNGQPDTAWENALKFPRHTECRTDPYPRTYESHLYTPICLVENTSMAHRRNILKYGVIDCFVRNGKHAQQEAVIRKSYPLTVQEIHSGWIKAAERIITIIPGRYGWDGAKRATLYEFDHDGTLLRSRKLRGKTGYYDVTIPPDGMAILERRD